MRLIALKQDLDRVSFVVCDAARAPQATARGLRLWWLIAALVKLGYTGYRGPLGAVSDLLERLGGSGMSPRTLYRALGEIESFGLIRRSACRFGRNWGGVEIEFTKACSKHLHLPIRRTLEKTTINGVSNSVVSACNISKAVQKQNKGRPVHRIDPVIYSLRCVLRGRADRAVLLAAAVRDQTARSAKILNWSRLKERWLAMTIPEREYVALNEVLPAIADFLRPIAERHGVAYVADIAAGCDPCLDLDAVAELAQGELDGEDDRADPGGESAAAIRGFIASQLAQLAAGIGRDPETGGDRPTKGIDRAAEVGEMVLDPVERDLLEAAKAAAAERMRSTG